MLLGQLALLPDELASPARPHRLDSEQAEIEAGGDEFRRSNTKVVATTTFLLLGRLAHHRQVDCKSQSRQVLWKWAIQGSNL